MCERLYEDYDGEQPGPGAIAAQRALAALDEYSIVGGALHIVTDDNNVSTHFLMWCRARPEWTAVEEAVFQAFLPLSEGQRAAALALRDGLVKMPKEPRD